MDEKFRVLTQAEFKAIAEVIKAHGLECFGGSFVRDEENGDVLFVGLGIRGKATYNKEKLQQQLREVLKVERLVLTVS